GARDRTAGAEEDGEQHARVTAQGYDKNGSALVMPVAEERQLLPGAGVDAGGQSVGLGEERDRRGQVAALLDQALPQVRAVVVAVLAGRADELGEDLDQLAGLLGQLGQAGPDLRSDLVRPGRPEVAIFHPRRLTNPRASHLVRPGRPEVV